MAHGDARERLLDAAVALILEKGYEAMRVEDLCKRTGLTKGAVFHHFRNKEELAVAAAAQFAARADDLFRRSAYHAVEDPRERLLAYVEQRRSMIEGGLADFTCLFGMMAQETFTTHPEISAACGRHIRDHARTLEPDIAAAQAIADTPLDGGPEGLALFMQAVVQGAFVLSKAQGDPAVARQCLRHLERYLGLLFSPPPHAGA